LEANSYPYQVIDFICRDKNNYLTDDELLAVTETFIGEETQVIGFSSTFFGDMYGNFLPANITGAMAEIRKLHPGIKFVLGGNNAENLHPGITSKFDAVVIGLAEDVMLGLMRWYDGQGPEPKSRRPVLHKTSFYYSDDVEQTEFSIQTCEHRWHDKDHILPGEVLPLEVSRGCIFHCRFCQYPLLGRSKYDYTRGMANLRDELMDNYQRWGTTNYYLLDDTFNDTPTKVKAFHEMVMSLPFRIRWCGYIRADLLHRFPETISMIKESGCRGAFFGIESFGKEAALSVGKGWSATHAREFLPDLVHKHWNDEVTVHISLIAGLPGDTLESMHETVDWLHANELYGWDYKPLWILKHQDRRIFSSTFAKEADKHGYTWPYPNNNVEWVNESSGWSLTTAMSASKEVNRRKVRDKHTHVWSEISYPTLGYPEQYTYKTPIIDIDQQRLKRKSYLWHQAYLSSLQGDVGARDRYLQEMKDT